MSFDLKIIAGDLCFENGDLAVIKGKDKLKQDLIKIATTEIGANPIHSWYGSLISNSLIGSTLPDDVIFSLGKSQLQNSIETLKKLQEMQAASGQKVTPDEQISYIQGISIQRNSQNLLALQVNIKVLTRAFGSVNASFAVE